MLLLVLLNIVGLVLISVGIGNAFWGGKWFKIDYSPVVSIVGGAMIGASIGGFLILIMQG